MTSENQNKRRKRQGFTLVELMVVIVIIGLLATVVAINVLPSQDRAMVAKAKADIAVLEQAIETYRLDNLNFPTDQQGLQARPGCLGVHEGFARLLQRLVVGTISDGARREATIHFRPLGVGG